jgi:hypothetical protein
MSSLFAVYATIGEKLSQDAQEIRISTDQRRRALNLVISALDRISDTPTSQLVEDAIRVARLVGDYVSLTWLELEVRHIGSKQEKLDVSLELIQGLGEERARAIHQAAIEHYLEERTIPDDYSSRHWGETGKAEGSSVAEIEIKVRLGNEAIRQEADLDLTTKLHLSQQIIESILARIRTRVVRYLTREERILGLSNDADALFDDFRAETDVLLSQVCPDALEKFAAACSAFMRNEPESVNHALTSCRRLIKAVADAVYPASNQSVIGVDGKAHEMGAENYVNRIVQWISGTHSRKTEQEVVKAALLDLHSRLTRLNDLACKGVHASVTAPETHFGLIQTYLTLGEIVRMGGKVKSAELEE